MTALPPVLLDAMAGPLQAQLADIVAGHCVRVDDLSAEDAAELARRMTAGRAQLAVHVLTGYQRTSGTDGIHISADRAVELRNRKERPLLLLVPSGAGHAASSLDNSFERIQAVELLDAATRELENRIADTEIAQGFRRVRTATRRRLSRESWGRFVAALAEDPTQEVLGRNLWRAGLIPDLDFATVEDRLEQNVRVVSAISRPSRPTAAAIDRLTAAGVVQGAFRTRLASVLETEAGPLSQALQWTYMLGERYSDALTFEKWPLTHAGGDRIQAIKIAPFDLHDGTLNKSSKLTAGAAGERRCVVGADKPGLVVVSWTTDPSKTDAVTRWRCEVLPPEDLRDEDTPPLATTLVKGDQRRARVQIAATAEDLESGSIFVVRVTAIDDSGLELSFDDGTPAQAESQDLIIMIDDALVDNAARRSTAASLPDAVLRLAVGGQDDLQEDVPSWDMEGGIFGLRIGERRLVQVRISPLLVHLQRRAVNEAGVPVAYSARSPMGQPLELDDVRADELSLPPALLDARRKLLSTLAGLLPRDVVEVVAWTPELRDRALDYTRKFRRALEATTGDAAADLLKLDTLTVSVSAPTGEVTGVVLLPTHPLRLSWVALHDGLVRDWVTALGESEQPRARRSSLVDPDLSSRVTPANLPFCLLSASGELMLYAEELTYGAALYLPADVHEPEIAADALAEALALPREGASLTAAAALLAQRIHAYRLTHPGLGALRMLSVNPGAGELLARVVRPVIASSPEEDELVGSARPRIEIIGYSDHLPFSDPLRRLTQLQADLLAAPTAGRESHLTPPMGLAARALARLLEDNEGHHVAVLQDVASGTASAQPSPGLNRAASFQDLITPLVSRRDETPNRVTWAVGPALAARGERRGSDLVDAHRSQQAALGRHLGGRDGVALLASLEADQLAVVDAVHQRADWVITVDRYVGLDFYDENQAGGLSGGYVLDYAPDFIEGLTQRLTVTTAHRPEVLRLLGDAMQGLGLAAVEGSASGVLDRLQVVSGRLALRLLGNTTMAREAVSLAALMTHLDRRGKLDGLIVVPVDAHPEIFGVAQRADDGPARRCDLMLVKVTSRSFSIECVEVKSRKDAALPGQLADHIVEQLTETRELLIDQFFATDPPRIDGDLQRSRFAGLLHYYADRAHANGLIGEDKIADVHRNIDRTEETAARPEISMQGYVISLEGNQGFPSQHRGVDISVLTADDLGKAGFTTRLEAQQRAAEADSPAASTAYPWKLPTAVLTPTPKSPPASSRTGSGPAPRSTPEDVIDATSGPPAPAAAGDRDATDDVPQGAGATADVRPAGVPHAAGAGQSEPKLPQYPGASGMAKASSGLSEPSTARAVLGADASAASPVELVVSTKGSPHAFILGIPGQGKSVTTRHVIREFAAQGLPSLVFDFHGDMAAAPPAGARVVDASEGLPFSPFELTTDKPAGIKTAAWEISEVIAFVTGMGPIQRTSLFKGLVDAYEACEMNADGMPARLPTVEEFADAVAARESGKQAQNARERLIPLTDFGLFSDVGSGGFDPRRGGMVVDLSQLMEAVQLAGGAFLLRKIYRDMFRWGASNQLRLAIVLDEAHRLARDVTLPKLMKEGRKYGVVVLVASQNLKDFSKDVVGNAGTKIVFRTNFPDSKAVAGFLKGRKGLDLTQEIERLGVGQAYVSTPDHTNARKVLMTED